MMVWVSCMDSPCGAPHRFTDCAVHSAKTTTDSTNATMISTADLDCQQTPHRLVASSSLEASNAQLVAVAQAAGYAAPAAEEPAAVAAASAADAATCLHTARPSGGDASPVAAALIITKARGEGAALCQAPVAAPATTKAAAAAFGSDAAVLPVPCGMAVAMPCGASAFAGGMTADGAACGASASALAQCF